MRAWKTDSSRRIAGLTAAACLAACAGQPVSTGGPATPMPEPPPPPTFESVPSGTIGTRGECVAGPVAEDPGAALATDARRVRVELPEKHAEAAGGVDEIHGLLQLCGVPPKAQGAAARQYNIRVPVDKVRATADGRVTVVFEPFKFEDGGYGARPGKPWILWLSKTPFPSVGAVDATTTADVYRKEHEARQKELAAQRRDDERKREEAQKEKDKQKRTLLLFAGIGGGVTLVALTVLLLVL